MESSNIFEPHYNEIKEVCKQENSLVCFRGINGAAKNIFAKGGRGKLIFTKGKSSEFGPLEGYVPAAPILSKKRESELKKLKEEPVSLEEQKRLIDVEDVDIKAKSILNFEDFVEGIKANDSTRITQDFVDHVMSIAYPTDFKVLVDKREYQLFYDLADRNDKPSFYIKKNDGIYRVLQDKDNKITVEKSKDKLENLEKIQVLSYLDIKAGELQKFVDSDKVSSADLKNENYDSFSRECISFIYDISSNQELRHHPITADYDLEITSHEFKNKISNADEFSKEMSKALEYDRVDNFIQENNGKIDSNYADIFGITTQNDFALQKKLALKTNYTVSHGPEIYHIPPEEIKESEKFEGFNSKGEYFSKTGIKGLVELINQERKNGRIVDVNPAWPIDISIDKDGFSNIKEREKSKDNNLKNYLIDFNKKILAIDSEEERYKYDLALHLAVEAKRLCFGQDATDSNLKDDIEKNREETLKEIIKGDRISRAKRMQENIKKIESLNPNSEDFRILSDSLKKDVNNFIEITNIGKEVTLYNTKVISVKSDIVKDNSIQSNIPVQSDVTSKINILGGISSDKKENGDNSILLGIQEKSKVLIK